MIIYCYTNYYAKNGQIYYYSRFAHAISRQTYCSHYNQVCIHIIYIKLLVKSQSVSQFCLL